jgi:chromosomal replication initiator protein
MNGLWERASDRIRDQLGQVGFETWIGPLHFIGLDGRTATIEAPNRFFKEWVNERYLTLLRQSLSAEIGEPVELKLTLSENGAVVLKSGNGNGHLDDNGPRRHASSSTMSPRTEMQQRDRHPQLNPRYTFTEFVVGSGNQFAHAAAISRARSTTRFSSTVVSASERLI